MRCKKPASHYARIITLFNELNELKAKSRISNEVFSSSCVEWQAKPKREHFFLFFLHLRRQTFIKHLALVWPTTMYTLNLALLKTSLLQCSWCLMVSTDKTCIHELHLLIFPRANRNTWDMVQNSCWKFLPQIWYLINT